VETPQPSEISDFELVQKSLQNPDFFGEIITRYEKTLDRFLFRIGAHEKEDREDALQESFVKAYKNLNEVDEDLSFSSWIYRITRNTWIDAFRKKKSRGQKLELSEEEEQIFWNTISDNNQDIEKNFQKKEVSELVKKALFHVPEKYREVLLLFFLEEKSYREISDILQKNENSIATLVSRGKAKLKEVITEKFPELAL
jgi:RNA polymerase sigma-70 factor (ECF subfamily)